MKNLLLIFIFTLGLAACTEKGEHHGHHMTKEIMDSLRGELLKTDISFSELSDTKGRKAAFDQFAGENATLLRPYSMPVNGHDSIMSVINSVPDSLYHLTWKPISADVARSGEIGFTYGTYLLGLKGAGQEEGTYCMVWHKDKDRKWKFIMETSNEGLSLAEKANDAALDAKEEKKK